MYTIEQLRDFGALQAALPGVHIEVGRREQYLSDAEFETVFKMPREKFAKQPVWRQQNMKRAAGLF